MISTDAKAPPATDSNTVAIRPVSRAIPNTVAPRSANNRATSAPNPDDAPVTRATFPLSCAIFKAFPSGYHSRLCVYVPQSDGVAQS